MIIHEGRPRQRMEKREEGKRNKSFYSKRPRECSVAASVTREPVNNPCDIVS
jgi:hypothetical protein